MPGSVNAPAPSWPRRSMASRRCSMRKTSGGRQAGLGPIVGGRRRADKREKARRTAASRFLAEPGPLSLKARLVEHLRVEDAKRLFAQRQVKHALADRPADVAEHLF